MYAGGIQPDGDRRDGADRPCRAGRGRPAGAHHAERRAPGDQCRGHDPTGRHSHNRGQRRGPGRLWPDPRPSQDGDACGGAAGTADDRDPQVPGAAVVVQEPAAGNLVPADSVVWFRTRTDVQANGVVRRLRLEAGQTTATYLVVAPDPPTHPLTVVTMPRAAQVKMWLETEFKSRCTWWAAGRIQLAASSRAAKSAAWFGWGRSGPEANLASEPRGSPSTRHRQRWWRYGQLRTAMRLTALQLTGDSNPKCRLQRCESSLGAGACCPGSSGLAARPANALPQGQGALVE